MPCFLAGQIDPICKRPMRAICPMETDARDLPDRQEKTEHAIGIRLHKKPKKDFLKPLTNYKKCDIILKLF